MYNLLSEYSNTIGIIGVGLVLIAYYLLQSNHLTSDKLQYSFLNLIGACLILVSLNFHWNWASVIIEIAWITISLKGIYKVYSKKPRVIEEVSS
jgi:hypothetical protein